MLMTIDTRGPAASEADPSRFLPAWRDQLGGPLAAHFLVAPPAPQKSFFHDCSAIVRVRAERLQGRRPPECAAIAGASGRKAVPLGSRAQGDAPEGHDDPGILIDELERALAMAMMPSASRCCRASPISSWPAPTAIPCEQIDLFDEVIAKLAAAIEAKARAKLSIRLADVPTAPAGVIRMLAFDDDIEVARPVLHGLRTPQRSRPARQRQQQEPAAPRRHLRAQVAERGGHRRAGDARRPRGRPVRRQQCRRALLRCRLPHAGEALVERRCAGDAGRRAARPAAPALPAPARTGLGHRPHPARGRKPAPPPPPSKAC